MSEEAPQFVEDPEKARAMAEAEAPFREAATAQTNEKLSDVLIQGANQAGEEAATHYDIEQGRIQDPEKAHAMALAGDQARSDAAGLRKNLPFQEHLVERYAPRQDDEPDSPWPPLHEIESRKLSRMQERAKRADDIADRQEYWAGFLHDHTISSEYQNRFPEVDFTPVTLAHLEQAPQQELQRADALEAVCQELEEKGYFAEMPQLPDMQVGTLDIPGDMFIPGMDRLLSSAGEDKRAEWIELIGNVNTTVGQLGKFRAELTRQFVIEPLRNQARITEGILRDLKSAA